MTLFEFISVMVSIVLGLSLAQMLVGISQFVRNAKKIISYAPHTVWIINLTLLHFLTWWSFWDYHDVEWNYARFLIIMLAPLTLFLTTSIIIPKDFGGDTIDLRKYFHEVRRWFFISFLVLEALWIFDGPLVFHSEPLWTHYRIPQLMVVTVFLLALWNKRDLAQHITVWTVQLIMLWSSGVRFVPDAF